ncbi:hypothetical protein EJ05DRAFT_245831 [Pseudovirgaria hyperparasitica]|uniref:Methyltransferase small domain-containing protein n=1 Tax=Pseudovirgaria hyperparasitica TaxID=470096 RepID=A0A6A6WED2_9PEZI|nr:uncharacterized protein EJ05DRAFT_245831 [Pseudovirgaria hyperparasitica]KAF2760895.1 hypothetical protein EJ05DRAFT_245831 [Pseudovirgaria hyperparasitica]
MDMLPTPDTSHVSFDRIYEPYEDSYLFLDTLSSATEISFLHQRFSAAHEQHGSPMIVETGVGSGVVLAFAAANAHIILGRPDVVTLGTDINSFACHAASKTVETAISEMRSLKTTSLDILNTDLTASIRPGLVDVLIFNPPYVPTEDLPDAVKHAEYNLRSTMSPATSFARDSHLLALSYAGGVNGMEVTNKLLAEIPVILHPKRGVAYVLLCAQNKPEAVKQSIRQWGSEWRVLTAGFSGKKGGWEKLQILRIWREP